MIKIYLFKLLSLSFNYYDTIGLPKNRQLLLWYHNGLLNFKMDDKRYHY